MRPQLPTTTAAVLTALLLGSSAVSSALAAASHQGHGAALASAHKRQALRARSGVMHRDLPPSSFEVEQQLDRRAGAPITVDTSAVAGGESTAAAQQSSTDAQQQATTTAAQQQTTTQQQQTTTQQQQQTTTTQQQEQQTTTSQQQQVTQSVSSSSQQQQSSSSAAPSSSSTPSSSAPLSTSVVTVQPTQSSSAAASSSSSAVTSTLHATVTNAVPSLISNTHTASSSASAGSGNLSSNSKSSGGLSKTALIAIIVVACSVVAVAAAWTIFRKWKLSPTKRFDARMKPLDFSPTGGEMADAAYYEKTRRTSADYARQAYVNELDNDMYDGPAAGGAPYAQPLQNVPSHDFTAGAGAVGGEYGYPPGNDYYGHPHQQYSDYPPDEQQQGGLHRQPTLAGNNFAGAGAYHADDRMGAGSPPPVPQGYYAQQHDQEVLHDGQYAQQGGNDGGAYLHREPSLGRPTRGEGPYAAIPAAAAAGFGGGVGRPLA